MGALTDLASSRYSKSSPAFITGQAPEEALLLFQAAGDAHDLQSISPSMHKSARFLAREVMRTKELRIQTRYEATTFQSDLSLQVQNSLEQQPFSNGFLKFVNFSAVISWGSSNQSTEECLIT